MQPHVTLRPFELSDADGLINILAALWYSELDAQVAHAAASWELAHYLGASTHSFVAELSSTDKNPGVVGAALLALPGAPSGSHEALARELCASPWQHVPCELTEHLSLVEAEDRLAALHRSPANRANWALLKLLVVSPVAQGFGLGRRLFTQACSAAQEAHAPGLMLLTDSSCDVSFYDHVGLTCAQTQAFDDKNSKDFSLFVYELEFS